MVKNQIAQVRNLTSYDTELTVLLALAATNGNLGMLKWLKKNGCHWDSYTFENAAAEHGSLENMIWLLKNAFPWNESTFSCAAEHGSFENMDWLLKNGCPWDAEVFVGAVQHAQNNGFRVSFIKY